MERKLNNKGLTLVELIIAITMSTIVFGAVAMFLYSANKSYHAAESSIDVQMEAQILMEQMGNWVMESNRIYVSPSEDVLVLYNIPRNNDRDLTTVYPVSFSSYNEDENQASRRVIFASGTKLYMVVEDGISNAEAQFQSLVESPTTPAGLYSTDDIKDENCICEYLPVGDGIKAFTVKIAATNGKDGEDKALVTSVNVSLTLKEGLSTFPDSYTIKNTFSTRNGLYENFSGIGATPEASPEASPGS